jgi:uncharacterized membrane protein YhfC
MQNIDPLYILEPLVIIVLTVSLILYWRRKHGFSRYVFLFSLIAYAGAILTKVVVQLLTIQVVINAFGSQSIGLGLYYGIQTSLFEVGGAFLVARYAVERKRLSENEAGSYGISLAFWENGVYLGLFSLISLVSIYAVLAVGPATAAQTVYSALQTGQASLFDPPITALPQVGFGILERISSILAHCAWGYLVVVAVVFKRNVYLGLALVMGFLDFFVPFAGILGIPLFEGIIFLFSVLSLIVALSVAGELKGRQPPVESQRAMSSP